MESQNSAISVPSYSGPPEETLNQPGQVSSVANQNVEPVEASFLPSVSQTLNAADRQPSSASVANLGGSLLPLSETKDYCNPNESVTGFSMTDQYFLPKSPSAVATENFNSQFQNSDISEIVPISVVLPSGEMSYSSSLLQSEKYSDDGGGEKHHPVYDQRNGKLSAPWPSWEDAQTLSTGQSSLSEYSFSAQKIKLSGVGAGLGNLGNTCFMNAILQCFTHTVPLIQGLRSFNHMSYHRCCGDGFCVLRALHEHIEIALASSGRYFAPWKFADNLRYISSDFEKGEQEDAHEFLQCLLDRLGECCSVSLPKDKGLSSQQSNLVEQVFGGRLMSKLRCCNCGHSSDTYERLIDMSLEIENADTLISALESFTKVERIEDSDFQFTCEKCKEKVTVEKQLMLDRVPPIVAFHLKKFKTDGFLVEKISKHVEYPLELDLRPYCIETSDNNKTELKYELYAVVVHEGYSPNSGHYYSYVRSSPDTWYKLDDWKVTRVHEHVALYEDGYILFYAKQGIPWISSLMEDPKSVVPNNSHTSPKSVLDGIDVACNSYGSPNSDFCEAAEQRECNEGPNYQFSCMTRQDESHLDETRYSVEGLRRGGPEVNIDQNSTSVSDTSVPVGVLDGCCPGSSYDDEKTCFTSSRGENYFNQGTDEAEGNVFHPLTPSRSPGTDMQSPKTSEMTYHIPRDHLKSEEHGTKRKRTQNKAADDLETKEAVRFMKKNMVGSRSSRLLAAMMGPWGEGSTKKATRGASSPLKKSGNSRSKTNHSSVTRSLATAGFR